MPEKYVKRTNFLENLTPLDSSHVEVFLGFFWNLFIFLNSNLKFEFGPVWYRPKPEPDRTGSHRFCKPCLPLSNINQSINLQIAKERLWGCQDKPDANHLMPHKSQAPQGSLPNELSSGEESSGPSRGRRWLNRCCCCFMGEAWCLLFGFHHPCSLGISQKGFLEGLWKPCCDDCHVYLTSVAVINNSTKNYVCWRIGKACNNLQKVNECLLLGCMFAN